MSQQQYLKWLEKKRQDSQSGELKLLPWEPVGYFQFNTTDKQMEIEIECKRPCKYIYLKPTNMRDAQHSYSKYFDTNPLEIKFFGVKGHEFEGAVDKQYITYLNKSIYNDEYLKLIKVQIEVGQDEWIDVEQNQMLFNEEQGLVGSVKTDIVFSVLEQRDIFSVRVMVSNQMKKIVQLKAISLQLFVENDVQLKLKKCRNLRSALLDVKQYDSFNKLMVDNVCDEKFSNNIRVAMMEVLSQLMKKQPELIKCAYQNLDIEKFLLLNVLQVKNQNMFQVHNFLNIFMKIKQFPFDLLRKMLNVLQNICALKVTPSGLKGFFQILFWCHKIDQSGTFSQLLEILDSIGQKIKSIRKPQYDFLRNLFNISSNSFEKELFGDDNICFEQIVQQKSTIKQCDSSCLQTQFIQQKTNYGRDILIKLDKNSTIKEIFIGVEKNSQICKMRFQVYEIIADPVSPQNFRENLIFTQLYQDHIWTQLSVYAYETDLQNNLLQDQPNQCCINLTKLNLNCKYLKIQITHALQPQFKSVSQKVPVCNIIPYLFGHSFNGPLEDIQSIEDQFGQVKSNYSFHSSIQQAFNQKFDKFETSDENILYFKTIQEIMHQDNVPQTSSQTQNLYDLQDQLSQQLYESKIDFQEQKQLKKVSLLCQQIEEIQLQRQRQENDLQQDLEHNLDFLTTLAKKISQFLRKLDEQGSNETWRSNEFLSGETGRNISFQLFQNLIIYDVTNSDLQVKDPIIKTLSKEILVLLKDQLVDNLSEVEWQRFVIQVINKFLLKPIDIQSTQVHQTYSQKRVIELLDIISIPNGEIIAYLAQKLQVKLDQNVPVFQRSGFNLKSLDKQKEDIFSLASLIILLQNGYSKIPIKKRDHFEITHNGCYCFNCGENQNFITGRRYKCVNCPNLDSCQNCYSKHQQQHPNHCFVLIEEPLPLAPSEKQYNPVALCTPFSFVEPLSQDHKTSCDNCQINIIGSKMTCANCEDYNLCRKCYKDKSGHAKYHVFVEISNQLKSTESTPKCLFQVLDPMLYPMKLATSEFHDSPTRKMTNRLKRQLYRQQDVKIILTDQDTLPVLGIKRCLSSYEQKQQFNTIQSNHQEFPILQRLDHEDALMISFSVCVWICEYSEFMDVDKINMLQLTLNLVQNLLKLSSLNGIKNVLTVQNHFMTLFFNVLQLGSESLHEQFRQILEQIVCQTNFITEAPNKIMSQSEKNHLLQEQSAYHDIIQLLIFHLKLILQWILDYVLNPSKQTSYSTILHCNISQGQWQEHIQFVLEFLLQLTERLKVNEKQLKVILQSYREQKKKNKISEKVEKKKLENIIEESEMVTPLLPLGISRSLSVRQGPKQETPQVIDSFDKSSGISIKTIYDMIQLLTKKSSNMGTRSNFNFASNVNMWSLVLKAVIQIKVSQLIQTKIFDNLISSFLNAGYIIQETIFPEILQISQNIINTPSYQKEACNALMNVIFTLVDSNVEDFNPILYNLLKGWLDIFLTKQTPKPESYLKNPCQKAYCQFNQQGSLSLIINLSKFLIKHVNFGGLDGCEMAQYSTIQMLELADDLIKLLITSECQPGVLSLSEFFDNSEKYSKEVQKSIERLIDWYILNKSTSHLSSPATTLMNSLSDNLLTLFIMTSEHESISKLCIKSLINSARTIDAQVLKLNKSGVLSTYASMQINDRNCNILESLFKIWVQSDQLASFAAFNVNGFDYLIDRMGISENLVDEKQKQTQLSLLNATQISQYLCAQKLTDQDKTEQNDENQPLIQQEYATKINVIAQLNLQQQAVNGALPNQDWTVNKKGSRSRICHFEMINNNYSEYSLLLKLSDECEPKQIKIGFNTIWTEFNNKILGVPSQILIEGGLNEDNMVPMGSLEEIIDEGFTNYSVKCFTKNFLKINHKGDLDNYLEQSMNSLKNTKIRYLKLKIRRPIVSFIENLSLLQGKPYKIISISISFLSVIGHKACRQISRKNMIQLQKTSALHVLGQLCNPQYLDTLQILANKNDVIDKFKSSFDILSGILVTQENWLSPVFLAIASNNSNMGDWLLDNFMDLKRNEVHAKISMEIILSDYNQFDQRLQKLYSFIIKTIQIIDQKDLVTQHQVLISFIETFCSLLNLKTTDEKYSLQDKLQLSQQNVKEILNVYDYQFSGNAVFQKAINKLLINILFKTQTSSEMIKFCLNQIWPKVGEKSIYYQLLASILSGSNEAKLWILEDNKIELILNNLLEKLASVDPKRPLLDQQIQDILFHLICINSSIHSSYEITRKIQSEKWHIKLYESIKINSSKTNILKIQDKSILQMASEFIKTIIIGNQEAEIEFAQIMKKDTLLLETRRDFNYVSEILVPLLNAEEQINFCIHQFDSSQNKFVYQGKQSNSKKQSKQNIIESKLLNAQQNQAFQSTLASLTKNTNIKSRLAKSSWNLVCSLTNSGHQDNSDKINEECLKKGPFVIIIEGHKSSMTSSKCVVGLFSSQIVSSENVESDNSIDYEQSFNIPIADDSFLFYYENDDTLHFKIPQLEGYDYFGYHHMSQEEGQSKDEGSCLTFYYKGKEVIYMPYKQPANTYIDFNIKVFIKIIKHIFIYFLLIKLINYIYMTIIVIYQLLTIIISVYQYQQSSIFKT